MQKMIFDTRSTNTELGLTDGSFKFPLDKPMLCPHCSVYQNATRKSSNLYSPYQTDNIYLCAAFYKCVACHKNYLVLYLVDKEHSQTTFQSIYPSVKLEFFNDQINTLSPRFVEMYNQALASESVGNIDLAGIGYRAALEILVKDYAINELGKDADTVAKRSLANAIDDCFDEGLLKSADVVRILGNDYVHYQKKHPEHDFEILKQYMEIFIRLVDMKLSIAHPPVERR